MATRHLRLGFAPIVVAGTLVLATMGIGAQARGADPAQAPRPLDIVGHLGGAPHDVVLRDGYAYLATGYAFEVWDLRAPAVPVRTGQLPRRGFLPTPDFGDTANASRLTLDGPRAYLLDRNMVRIIDVADPTAPREAGLYSFWTDINDIAVRGDTLYLSAQPGGVGVATVDIADPTAPELVSYSDDGVYQRLVVAGDVLLAIGDLSTTASGPAGVRTYDISLPRAPRPVGLTAPLPVNAYDLAVDGHYLYATWNGGLHIYDLADPTTIHELARFRTAAPVDAVDVDQGRAYITNGGALEVLDLADPAAPRSVGRLELGSWWGDAGQARVAAAGGLAMVTHGGGGLIRVVDVAQPGFPRQVARLDVDLPHCLSLAVDARHAYVADYSPARGPGLSVVDVSTPASPVVVGGYALPQDGHHYSIRDLTVLGARLYLLVWVDSARSELRVLDLSTPAAPRLEAVADLGETVGDGLLVRGGLAYVAAYVNGQSRRQLQVVALLGPGGPRLVGTAEITGATPGGGGRGRPSLALLGRHIVLGTSRGTAIVDVADPVRPVVVGNLQPPGLEWTHAVAASRTHAYGIFKSNADRATYLRTFDLADPAAAQVLGQVEPNWVPLNLGLSADHLFAGSPSGVQMFDFSRPDRLRRVGQVSLPSEVDGSVLRNGYAYVADRDAGLFILFTGDADLPEVVPPTATPASPAPPASPTPPRTATPTAVPPTTTPSPRPTASGPTPAAGPIARVCPQIVSRVPRPVLDAALANPERVGGWNQLQNPSLPPGPFNARRLWLTLRVMGLPFDLLFNPVLYRASCP